MREGVLLSSLLLAALVTTFGTSTTAQPRQECGQHAWDDHRIEICQFTGEANVTAIEQAVESWMTANASGPYIDRHFTPQRLRPRWKYREHVAYLVEFTYQIDGYTFRYTVPVNGSNGSYAVGGFTRHDTSDIPRHRPPRPRPISDLIGRDVVAERARDCIGVADISYQVEGDGTAPMRLVGNGEEPVDLPGRPHNVFTIDLESGDVQCWEARNQLLRGGEKPSPHWTPCYDCWSTYLPVIVSIAAALLLLR